MVYANVVAKVNRKRIISGRQAEKASDLCSGNGGACSRRQSFERAARNGVQRFVEIEPATKKLFK